MKNNNVDELKTMEKQFDSLLVERNEILIRMKVLEQNTIVQEYINLVSLNERLYSKLSNTKESYIKLKQKNCTHPLWYFISETTDSYECRTYYTCKCLECDLIEEKRSRDFNNVIKGNYQTLKEEYDKRKMSPAVKAKQIIKKREVKKNDISTKTW